MDKNIIDQLESIIQQLKSKKVNNNEEQHKIIHLKKNPASVQVAAKQLEFVNLKKENERLKARIEILESGADADVTRRQDEAVNIGHQVEELTKKVEEYKVREEKILTSFRKTAREFREVCYLLTGYRIDALRDGKYGLSSMYAEREEDKLYFHVGPDGVIELLKNDYSDKLSEFVRTYLESADSFPAFLSAITLDLFKSSTQIPNMSVCMDTTMLEQPNYNRPKS